MQNISNLLMNLLLLCPLLYVEGYCIGENKKQQIEMLKKIAVYLFVVNFFFIKMGSLIEEYLIFYTFLMIPSVLSATTYLKKENKVQIEEIDQNSTLKERDRRFMLMVFGAVAILLLLMIVNHQEDDQVLIANKQFIQRIKETETPEIELIKIAENPRTLLTEYKKLKNIDPESFEIVYSGNSKKSVRGAVVIENNVYLYDLTYRRNDDEWELDGLYDWSIGSAGK